MRHYDYAMMVLTLARSPCHPRRMRDEDYSKKTVTLVDQLCYN